MRIEACNQIIQTYNSTRPSKAKSAASTDWRDQVQISSRGYDYQIAKQAVAETPDIREDRVAPLKNSIASGSYKVEPGDFAAKLIEKYEAYR